MCPFAVWYTVQSNLPGNGGNETYNTWGLIIINEVTTSLWSTKKEWHDLGALFWVA